MPQPTAAPLTAATTGTFVCSSASAAGVRRGRFSSESVGRSGPAMISLTSSPEQKAGSAPVITRQRTSSSPSDRTTASSSA